MKMRRYWSGYYYQENTITLGSIHPNLGQWFCEVHNGKFQTCAMKLTESEARQWVEKHADNA
jgi:hypothetical protein